MGLLSFLVLGLLLGLQLQAAAGKRVAYFMDNDVTGNSIVSLLIDSKTGLLSSPVLTPTGGKGGIAELAPPGKGLSGPDALFAQNAVVVKGNYLFAVNAGSNTLSFFHIPKHDPAHPILVGNPADTLGDFPISVAYSSKLKTACVVNSGAISGVTCYCVSKEGLISLDTSPRSLAAHYNQTTPPAGPALTASDVLFNPSSTAVFAILKGNQNTATPGTIFVYPVVEGNVSRDPVISSPPELFLDYGSVFLNNDRLLVTDGSFGSAIVDVSSSFAITEESKTVYPNVGAPCWAAYSRKFNSVYVLDTKRYNITVVSPKSGAITGYIPFTGALPGGYDAALDREWLYVLPRFAAVLVFKLDSDVRKIELVQTIDLSSVGNRTTWEGMAIYH